MRRKWLAVFVAVLVAALVTLTVASPPAYVVGDIFVATGPYSTGRIAAGDAGKVLMSNGAAALPTYQAAAGTGTVTSVAMTAPTQFAVGGSPVTTTGTLALSWNTQNANKVLAGPTTGADAAPTFRALVAADIPSLSTVYGAFGTLSESGDSPPPETFAIAQLTDGDLLKRSGTTIATVAASTLTVSSAATATSAGSCTGNSVTATTLVTPRAIYGSNFDGSADITGPIIGTYGGTGVNNSTKTITLGGNFTTSGAFATTLTATNTTTVTLPTTGTLATLAGAEIISGKQMGMFNYAADTSANDDYAIALSPALSAYVTGQIIIFKALHANTTASTLNVNGLGAKAIVKRVSTATATGDILLGQFCMCVYDGTSFVIMNPVVN